MARSFGKQAAATIGQLGVVGHVPYLGHDLTLIGEPGRERVHRRGDALLVPIGARLRPALERWYRRAARAEIKIRLDRACARTGHSYERLTIRDQRTRWASCSQSGTMSFSWRLLLAPEEVLEYVVWHEVCHLEQMNHSRKFWGLVAQRCPDYREQISWLRANADILTV